MATVRSNNRRSGSSRSSRQHGSSSGRSSSGERKPLQGRDTGYRVGGGHRQNSMRRINPRLIIVGIVAILMVIAMVFGISSCVKGCSSSKKAQKTETEQKVNPTDKRVAYGVSTEVTDKLSAVLDRNETFAKIAKYADKITDERLIDLAIAEPEAIDFVAGSIKADGSTQPFGTAAPQGEFPQLFTFDTRWGYMAYADGILGVTGSGPVALSMASIGLSGGNTTYDPVAVAQAITTAKLAKGTSGMDDSFLVNHAADAGLTAYVLEASSDGIYGGIADNMPVLIKLKADSGIGSNEPHWALITQLNTDNSITVYDPTSAIASSHTWSLGAVAGRCDTAYALTTTSGTTATGGADASSTDDEAYTDEYTEETEEEQEQ